MYDKQVIHLQPVPNLRVLPAPDLRVLGNVMLLDMYFALLENKININIAINVYII